MKKLQILLSLLALMLIVQGTFAQNETRENPVAVSSSDSAKVAKHSPTTAMLLSIIPGGGQIYNKKYWKLPIVYGCLAASSYFVYTSADKMVKYRNEYINRRDGHVELLDPALADRADENIIQLKNDYRRNMEIAIGITAILYVLNIVDAMVDAHLYYFDISDDLSLRWSPSMTPQMASRKPAYGLSLQFNF